MAPGGPKLAPDCQILCRHFGSERDRSSRSSPDLADRTTIAAIPQMARGTCLGGVFRPIAQMADQIFHVIATMFGADRSSDDGELMSQMAWNADQMRLGQGGRCLEPDQNQTKVLRICCPDTTRFEPDGQMAKTHSPDKSSCGPDGQNAKT